MMKTRLHFSHALLPDGWRRDVRVTIDRGAVFTVEAEVASGAEDERHSIALPGMPNLHSHAFQRGMAGLAEVQGPGINSFWTWREVMYRFVDRLTPDDLAAIAALAYMEMLEAGFTRVGEFHYLHHDVDGGAYADPSAMSLAILEAAAHTGIALTLLPVFYAHSGFGGAPPGHGQRRFVQDLDGFVRLLQSLEPRLAALPGGVLGLAPHSLRAVTADQLTALGALRPHQPIHIHVAEQTKEVDDCIAWSGARPIEWLLDHAGVDPSWCLVHATHVTSGELSAIAATDAVVGLCPVTEANLGDGIFPAGAFQAAGGRFGIGSDSNVLIDMTDELRLLEYGQRLTDRGRNRLAGGSGRSTADSLFNTAVLGGSQALGAGSGIEVGRSADFVSLNSEHPSLYGKAPAQILDAFVFAAGRSAIDSVWRAGTKVVQAGLHRDRQRIIERYKRVYTSLTA